MSKSKFFDKIKHAKEEREVENVYNEGISLYFLKEDDCVITHPYKCDGLVDWGLFLRLIIEYKFNEELKMEVKELLQEYIKEILESVKKEYMQLAPKFAKIITEYITLEYIRYGMGRVYVPDINYDDINAKENLLQATASPKIKNIIIIMLKN